MKVKTVFTVELDDGTILGIVRQYDSLRGFKFISNIPSHGNSRKYHSTSKGAVPAWARYANLVPVEVK